MKKKGYTLFEALVVISIIVIISGVASASISRYNKGRDNNMLTNELKMKFHMIAGEAFNTKSKIQFVPDYDNNLILFKKEGTIIEKIKLPKGYNYSNNASNSAIYFTETGNVSPMFSFFVKDEDGSNVLKLTFSSVDKFVKSVHIRQYIYENGVEQETN